MKKIIVLYFRIDFIFHIKNVIEKFKSDLSLKKALYI